jgi:hyperosmotically inducible periplasmic protein
MPETKLNTSKRLLAAGLTIGALSVVLMAPRIRAQTSASSESERQENLSAQSVERHHYASPVGRAQDAPLLVKIKAAIADERLADNYPVTVDADHGRVTLTGVLASPQDVQRAVNLVAGIDGVAGVNNRLTWQKVPE